MEFRIVHCAKNIKWFSINNEHCLYNTSKQVFNLISNQLLFDSEINLQEVHFKNKFFVNNLYGKGIYFDAEMNPVKTDFYIHGFESDYIMYSLRENEDRNTYFENILNHKKNKIIGSSTINLLVSKLLFRKNFEQNSIEVFTFPTAQLLWQFYIEKKYNWMQKSIYEGESEVERQAEVTKFIGIYKDVLWLVLNSGRLLGLDVTTGDLKYNLEKPINYDEENKLFLPTIFSTIDVERGIMFAIGNTSYIEINLEAPVTSYMIYDISETCRINNVEADYPGYDLVWEGDEIFIGKNELYFEKYPCYVGIFNRKSKEITWSSKELDETGRFKGISKIDYALNKLYVLDRENTLHIFEKE